jgi:hypothetical protein
MEIRPARCGARQLDRPVGRNARARGLLLEPLNRSSDGAGLRLQLSGRERGLSPPCIPVAFPFPAHGPKMEATRRSRSHDTRPPQLGSRPLRRPRPTAGPIHDAATRLLQPQPRCQRDEPARRGAAVVRLGSRPSLGYPGDKYEMGLEAIEEIEVIAAELAAEVFDARLPRSACPRAPSRTSMPSWRCQPGDTIIAPPCCHRRPRHPPCAGCAGLYGLRILPRPWRRTATRSTPTRWRRLPAVERPRLITIGGSLNLEPNTRWPSCAPSPTRWARRSSSTRRINAGSSRGALEEPADRGRAPDDDEHLQKPGRTRGRADRHQ